MKNFKDKVAAITGAASGMGRALSLQLAQRGCHLALSDVNEAELRKVEAEVKACGGKVTCHKVDVANRQAVFQWADEVVAEHGKVNLIFNNAGVTLVGHAETLQPADFEWVMGINFWGVINGTQAFLPYLKASGDGHIINTSSVFGLVAMPTQSAYNASKFAVRGFTEALRMELDMEQCSIGVTCVHPGGVATNIANSARMDGSLESHLGISPEKFRKSINKIISKTTPDQAATAIIHGVERNARRVLIGSDAKQADLMARTLGPIYQSLVIWTNRRKAKRKATVSVSH